MKRILMCLLVLMSLQATAQELSYGFKVGLNFSSFRGDSEQSDAGADLESFDFNSGFHVGGGVIYKITDRFGVKGDILYSQRGVKHKYEGEAFQRFTDEGGNFVVALGERKYLIQVSNSYIELPITGYAKLNDRFEVFGGANISFLVGSRGVGEYSFQGSSPLNAEINEIFELEHNYYKDKTAAEETFNESTEFVTIANGTGSIVVPKQLTAYSLDYPEKDGAMYNVFDVGLHAGIAFYLNGGLYLSGTVNYGLLDVTNDFYDISRKEINGTEYISRSDNDQSLSIQASVGFSF